MLVVVVVAACAHPRPAPVTCGIGWSPLSARHAPGELRIDITDRDAVIRSVQVAGIDPAVAVTLRSVVETRAGQRMGDAPLSADLRRLWRLGVISDARIEVQDDQVSFVVSPRPRVGRVIVARADPSAVRRFRLLAGAPFEPARITRIAAATELGYVRDGHLDAEVNVSYAPRAGGVDVCVDYAPGPRVTIEAVRFPGRSRVPEAALLGALHGAKAGVNTIGGIFDADALAADQIFLTAEYYERGMVNVAVGDPTIVRHGSKLIVEIPISEGPVFHIGSVSIPGAPSFRHDLARGDVFVRSRISEVTNRLQQLVGSDLVLPVTSVDLASRTINLTFTIEWRWPWDALRSWSWPSH